MHARIFTCLCTIVAACLTTQAFAQQKGYAPVPPTSATFASYGDARKQQDEEKDALAKQLDEFHKRLQALEAGSKKTTEEQKEGTYVDRIGKLEEGLGQTNNAINEIGDEISVFPEMGHGGGTMQVFGRIHADWWGFPDTGSDIPLVEGGDPQDRFIFRRARIGVGGTVHDNMVYKIEIEFAGGNDLQYRDVYLGWDDLPIFQRVLIGNQKRPYGLDHLNSSRYNVFMERPFAVEAFNQDSRRMGIASYGVSQDQRFNWRYGVYNQQLIQARSGYVGNNYQAEFAGRAASTWWYDECSGGRGYGHVGISGSYGSPDGLDPVNNQARYRTRPEARSTNRWINTGRIAGANEYFLGGLEWVFNAGPLNITAEYQAMQVDRLAFFGNHLNFHGGYAQAAYMLTGEHMPWNRRYGTLGRVKPFENFFAVCDCEGFLQRGMGAWQIAARYSYADFSSLDIDGGLGSSVTLGLNWYWNPYARLQFNYIFGNIASQQVVDGEYQIFGIRAMIDF